MKSLPRKGQASLELAVAMGGILLLLIGGLNIFVWLNKGMVNKSVSWRNQDPEQIEPEQIEPLRIFN